jgi:hypothetical protein
LIRDIARSSQLWHSCLCLAVDASRGPRAESPAAAALDKRRSGYGYVLSVQDCDAKTSRAQELGAHVMMAPQDVPGTGRFAVLKDPTGAVFALIAITPM